MFRFALCAAALATASCGGGGGGSSTADASSTATATAALPTFTGITRLEITSTETAFEGMKFGSVGSYVKLRGKAYGELDPADPRNAVITDLALAPRNARGHVEYAMDVYLLKPADASLGNHKLFMEVNNRGAKLFGVLNRSPLTNDPITAADAGQALLLNNGYTIAWSGWDPTVAVGGDRLSISLPVAKNATGTSITGPAYEFIEADDDTTTVVALSLAAASTDRSKAQLTVRSHLGDTAVVVPSSGWDFVGNNAIQMLPAGTTFKQGSIYELTYAATDPVVAGIGFAATRDFVSFLRHARKDTAGQVNPVAGDLTRAMAFAFSQPARYLNDFVGLGFNQDELGGPVFDGVLHMLGGAAGVALNVRFAQPGRTERNRQNHLYPEAVFPFSYNTFTDTLTGKTDGRNRRCLASGTCPRVMVVNSANEYWGKAASLGHTDSQGQDLPDPANVRYYMVSGVEHTGYGSPADSRGVCAQPRSTVDPMPAVRALFKALEDWTDGTAPPPSAVPRVADGTAILSDVTVQSRLGVGRVAQAALGWPDIPGVGYTGVITVRALLDFGPDFDAGIVSLAPPQPTGKVYPSFVSRVDADGNELAGIRLPPVAAPTATFTGWGLRATAFGGPDGCDGSGQALALPVRATQRVALRDPRLSLAERYVDHAGYVAAVRSAANALVARRLLLPVDAAAYIDAASASAVLVP